MQSERIVVCEVAERNNGIVKAKFTTPEGEVQQQDALFLNWHLRPGESFAPGKRYRFIAIEIDIDHH